jgi:hypothetical protein
MFIRAKQIKGRTYYYAVQSYRQGGVPRHKTKYLMSHELWMRVDSEHPPMNRLKGKNLKKLADNLMMFSTLELLTAADRRRMFAAAKVLLGVTFHPV